jgi:hypothetical protein
MLIWASIAHLLLVVNLELITLYSYWFEGFEAVAGDTTNIYDNLKKQNLSIGSRCPNTVFLTVLLNLCINMVVKIKTV